jgi:hypothetical protein
MAKTWLIIVLIVSLVLNAFLLGFLFGKPPQLARVPRVPFPPLPPELKGGMVEELRRDFLASKLPTHRHLGELRRQLVMEMASDSTDRTRVDSLLDEICQEQRALQEEIINFIDTVKIAIPPEERMPMRQWIMQSFGEQEHQRGRHPRRSHRPPKPAPEPGNQLPTPESPQ